MKRLTSFGISDIAFYVPAPAIELAGLKSLRAARGGPVTKLERAITYTGQVEMRIPDWYEDTVTMVAEATHSLLERNPQVSPSSVRHYCCGTETPQDYAKPVTSYCQGLVEVGGESIGPNVSVYEVKHACAGGTYALLGTLSHLRSTDHCLGVSAPGIVTMGDVALYEEGTTAELTQGAGAVALLVEKDPRLLAIDDCLVGTYSTSVDDFFRSIGNSYASVKGRFSVECYKKALIGAYEDFKSKALVSELILRPEGKHFLDAVDYVVLHAPFHSMPGVAMKELLVQRRGMSAERVAEEIDRLRLSAGLNAVRRIGNLYTGSLYLCLGDLLADEYRRLGNGIENKRVLLFSYGSGNTMVAFSGTIVPGAGKAIEQMGMWEAIEARRRLISPEEYEQLVSLDKSDRVSFNKHSARRQTEGTGGRYAMSSIREDGYRLYSRR